MNILFTVSAVMVAAALVWLVVLTGNSQEAELKWIQGVISFVEYRQVGQEMMKPVYLIAAALVPFGIGIGILIKAE